MADEDSIKRLEARLTRLEAALAQQPGGVGGSGGFTPPGGAVVDPSPFPGGGYGGWYPRWPHPVVDPGPWWPRWPHPVVDPGPFPRPVVDPGPFPNPVVDPASFAGAAQTRAAAFGRIGHVGDPPPIDVSRFSIQQLEASLHSINAERARLNSMETMIKQQLETLKQQG